ncbi:hypothetical protein C9374_013714, partial [Naegleria lovaniensis]
WSESDVAHFLLSNHFPEEQIVCELWSKNVNGVQLLKACSSQLRDFDLDKNYALLICDLIKNYQKNHHQIRKTATMSSALTHDDVLLEKINNYELSAEQFLKMKYFSTNDEELSSLSIESSPFGNLNICHLSNNRLGTIYTAFNGNRKSGTQIACPVERNQSKIFCETNVNSTRRIICIEMELLQGNLFSQLLSPETNVDISENLILQIGYQVCSALSYLDAVDMVHINLKPENILVRNFDAQTQTINVTLSDVVCSFVSGTGHSYIPPEYAANEQNSEYTNRGNIFILGVILCQLILHDKVFNVTSTTTNFIRNRYGTKYSETLLTLIDFMLLLDPNDRLSVNETLERFSKLTNQRVNQPQPLKPVVRYLEGSNNTSFVATDEEVVLQHLLLKYDNLQPIFHNTYWTAIERRR